MSAIINSQRSLRAGGGTAEDIRDRNVSSILGWLHRNGSLSRAELTRLTGLNRSTVGVVIGELVALGLAVEKPGVGGAAGRPSSVVTLDERTVAFAVNPEVDGLSLGLVGFGGAVLRSARIPLPERPSAADVVQLARAGLAGMVADGSWNVIGAGVAVPGQVRLADGVVRDATHLGWIEEPLAEMLEAAIGFPVQAANAATLALRAESAFGAGRGLDDVFYIIGGASGIGGGSVLDGRIVFGAHGYAGEVGHIFVADNGVRCHCGATGCFETEVSRDDLLGALGLDRSEAALLPGRLRASTDPVVAAVVEHMRAVLAHVVRTVVNLFNPSAIVVGGFLALVVEGVALEAIVGESVRASRDGLDLLTGSSDPALLLVGAAELPFAELIADPRRLAAPALGA